ncbi:YwqH-like family protein [Bacillus sp. NPDC077027]|uniref:YwqH-like family protein n=1 Tax=Bacillus sp. NPDC077027 TaxID=3390548 RepID=UPI003CFED402
MTISGTIIGYTTALYSLKADISTKKEQIAELKLCRKELKKAKVDLLDASRKIKHPVLTSDTWYGKLADTFDDIRDVMKSASREIKGTQLTNILNRIDEKISDLTSGIHSLENEIRSVERKIEKEKQKQLEEKRGK